MTAPLPPGLTIGAIDPATDLDEITAFVQRVCIAESGRPYLTKAEIAMRLGMPDTDPAADTLVLRDATGALVGAEWIERTAPFVMTGADGFVAPERCGEGIGSFLLQWARTAAAQHVGDAPDGARVILSLGVDAEHRPSIELLEGAGGRLRRYFLEMRIDFDGPIPEPVLPDGIALRTIVPGVDDLEAWLALDEAFRDHFGHVERPHDIGVARLRSFMERPEFDPELWWLAVDGAMIAGNCFCYGSVEDDDRVGYVGSLGVRRPWRNRGLAKALLRTAFIEMRNRGKTAVTLHVDAESLTVATRLYESVGMRESDRIANYEFELRPGEELQVT